MEITRRMFYAFQLQLMPILEEEYNRKLSCKEQEFVRLIYSLDIDPLLRPFGWNYNGRKPHSRRKILLAYFAKCHWNMPTTTFLVEQLRTNTSLRRLCEWENGPQEIPDQATFSRAFADFSQNQILQKLHEKLIKENLSETIIYAVSTDSTSIKAREKATKKPAIKLPKKEGKRKRGRPKKRATPTQSESDTLTTGEEEDIQVTLEKKRLERHSVNTLATNLQDMPEICCDYGCKKNSQGFKETTKGYKLHLAISENGIPIAAYLSSASLHDSQADIILQQKVSERTLHTLYQLKDSAYDSQIIRKYSEDNGSVAIIDFNKRNSKTIKELSPYQAQLYKGRSGVERSNSDIKDNHGARNVRVRGGLKVMCHLMFGLIAVAADALYRAIQTT